MNEANGRSQAPLPRSLAVPKPERSVYEGEGEGAEYNLYQHGRKRAKLHDGGASPVLQVSMWCCMLCPPPWSQIMKFHVC